jgi:hypothetical protein
MLGADDDVLLAFATGQGRVLCTQVRLLLATRRGWDHACRHRLRAAGNINRYDGARAGADQRSLHGGKRWSTASSIYKAVRLRSYLSRAAGRASRFQASNSCSGERPIPSASLNSPVRTGSY